MNNNKTKEQEIAENIINLLDTKNEYLSLREIYDIYYEIYGMPLNDERCAEADIRRAIYRHCKDRDLNGPNDDIYFYSLFPKKTFGNRFGLTKWDITEDTDDLEDLISRIPDDAKLKEINDAPFIKTTTISKEVIVRRKAVMISALMKANYMCEIDENHPSFIRKSNLKNYTEAHHLIPLEYQKDFEQSLDITCNVVSLCSNCHNQLHYGSEKRGLLKKLYNERKNELEQNGLAVDFDTLCKYYNL